MHLSEVHSFFTQFHQKSKIVKLLERVIKLIFECKSVETCPAPDEHLMKVVLHARITIFGYLVLKIESIITLIGSAAIFFDIDVSTPMFKTKFYQFVIITPTSPMKTQAVDLVYTKTNFMDLLFAKINFYFSHIITERDRLIWNNKLYSNNKSHLVATDEAIVKFKRWYNKFYSNNIN